MSTAEPGAPARTSSGPSAALLGTVAVVACCAFRAGALPGGLVGVDLALALLGWWVASAPTAERAEHRRPRALWQLGWPALALAVVLAVVWVLVEPSVRRDDAVRGQALAAFGGYGNWHLLAVGPAESLPTRFATPLQGLWGWGVLVQVVLVWLVVERLAVGRAGDREGRRPLLLGAVAACCWLGSLAALLLGASDQALLLATPMRATGFFAAAAVAAASTTSGGRTVRAVALGIVWPALALLGVLSVLAAPDDAVGRICGPLVVPVLAVVVVAATGPWPEGRRVGGARPSAWVVGAWFLVPPALAIAHAAIDRSGLVAGVATVVVGALVAAGPVLAYGWFVEGHAPGEPTSQRRRVLAPPAVVALLVVLASVTGAFHWESPQPVERRASPAEPGG